MTVRVSSTPVKCNFDVPDNSPLSSLLLPMPSSDFGATNFAQLVLNPEAVSNVICFLPPVRSLDKFQVSYCYFLWGEYSVQW